MILLLAVFFGFYFHPLYRAAGVFGEEECGGCAIIYNGGCCTGPGCSSVGGGMLSELGPFYPTLDGVHLLKNPYSWNKGKDSVPYCRYL
jgi:hypothetical protein